MIWSQGTPYFRNNIAGMCYLYRTKGLLPLPPGLFVDLEWPSPAVVDLR